MRGNRPPPARRLMPGVYYRAEPGMLLRRRPGFARGEGQAPLIMPTQTEEVKPGRKAGARAF